MASLRDIKRRIGSVKSTQKITRAMKMVAASKLRRAQEAIVQARPYAFYMRELVGNLSVRADSDAHPLLRRNERGKIAVVVFTSDRGLCGGYNAGIINRALAFADQHADREVQLTVIGRKGVDALKQKHHDMGDTFQGHSEERFMGLAERVVEGLVEQYEAHEVAEVHCIYNNFQSAVVQEVTVEQLLPFESFTEKPSDERDVDYLYEPSQDAIFSKLLERHMAVQIHRMLFESAASEYGARMTAMDSATRNAGEVIDRLTLEYNRARQTAITTELIEVVSGAEAL